MPDQNPGTTDSETDVPAVESDNLPDVESALRIALEQAETERGRYHIRQALQHEKGVQHHDG